MCPLCVKYSGISQSASSLDVNRVEAKLNSNIMFLHHVRDAKLDIRNISNDTLIQLTQAVRLQKSQFVIKGKLDLCWKPIILCSFEVKISKKM